MAYTPPIISLVVPQHKVVEAACVEICRLVREAVAARGVALVGCSGSASLFELYANLGLVGKKDMADWSRVVFFAVDEAYVAVLRPVRDDAARGGRIVPRGPDGVSR